MSLENAFKLIERFTSGSGITNKISEMEADLEHADRQKLLNYLGGMEIGESVFRGALDIKKAAGQINVVIHALGILLCLPHIMEDDETVEHLSIGAGNTGKDFDVVTSKRIAEFKFINWRGGSESIRQNSIFKDFFSLAEFDTPKKRVLYVVNKRYPINFLQGSRALKSVCKDSGLRDKLFSKYGERYQVVSQYYNDHKHSVEIVDLNELVPWFKED